MSTALTSPHAGESAAYRDFLNRFPEYARTSSLDELRGGDFPALAESKQVYLDYTGSGLYGQSQIREHYELISGQLFGNPHSRNAPSIRSTTSLEKAKHEVLDYFHAVPDEYSVIFTTNATAALKLVGESFPFAPGSQLAMLADNHNSVQGIREFAHRSGANTTIAPIRPADLSIDSDALRDVLSREPRQPSLFAYPAQSNFSGVRHQLDWIEVAHRHGWTVVLDAAAFVPTSRLDLRRYRPDFVALSFYKMFGWPTGIGCLIARDSALARLNRPWFAGGTVTAASAREPWHALVPNSEAFEDGTPNFLNALGVPIGLNYLRAIDPRTVETRLRALTGWLLEELTALRHDNGHGVCTVYGPTTTESRGATIALNFVGACGNLVDERLVEQEANAWNIALRTGCFCNPGVGERIFDISPEKLASIAQSGASGDVDWYVRALGLPTGGAIRISLGHISDFKDAYQFVCFARSWRNWRTDMAEGSLPPRTHC